MDSRIRQVLLSLLLLTTTLLSAQKKYTLSGTITEAASNETLIGVSLVVPELRAGVTTNEYGFYSLTLPEGSYEIRISYLGFKDVVQSINFDRDQQLNFQLAEQAEQLEEVTVTEDVERINIRKPQMSVNTLSVQTIQQIPVVLGEADVIKSILLLPGVTNAGESSSGFNVRGGAADQNLILLDEATIFNSSHIFIYR